MKFNKEFIFIRRIFEETFRARQTNQRIEHTTTHRHINKQLMLKLKYINIKKKTFQTYIYLYLFWSICKHSTMFLSKLCNCCRILLAGFYFFFHNTTEIIIKKIESFLLSFFKALFLWLFVSHLKVVDSDVLSGRMLEIE